jgi:hypothetical protein
MAAEFSDYFLPFLRVLTYTFRADPLKRQAPHFQLAVMTTDAVLSDDGAN